MLKRISILSIAILCGATVIFSSGASKQISEKENANRVEQRFQAAADYSKDHRGLSILVMRSGKVVFEQYHNGHSADKPHILASGTKSFSGAMAAAAIEDGLLKPDEKVADTITEWKADQRKSQITIRQLITLTSGIEGGRTGVVPSYAEAIQGSALYDPGTRFQYGPIPFQIFGEVMRRKLASRKESVMDYLKRRILDPIGLKPSFWRRDRDGNPNLPSGAALTAREWAKFGELIKNGGQWQGKQILRRELVAECFKGTETNPAYGLTFWLNNRVPPDKARAIRQLRRNYNEGGIYSGAPADLVMAAGLGKQRLYIIPSLDLVIVRQGESEQFEDSEFLARLLKG